MPRDFYVDSEGPRGYKTYSVRRRYDHQTQYYTTSKTEATQHAARLQREENEKRKRRNPTKKQKKPTPQKRISAALTKYLRKINPAMRGATAVRVKKLKGGGVTITPVKGNVAEGFYDATGFHPIRKSRDYDADRAGDEY